MEIGQSTGSRTLLTGALRIASTVLLVVCAARSPVADVQSLGEGCSSGTGIVPQITATTPYVAEPFELHLSWKPGAQVLWIAGLTADHWQGIPLPIDLGAFGDCSLWVAPTTTQLLSLDGDGSAAISATGWPAGITVYVQLVGLNQYGGLDGASAGLALTSETGF